MQWTEAEKKIIGTTSSVDDPKDRPAIVNQALYIFHGENLGVRCFHGAKGNAASTFLAAVAIEMIERHKNDKPLLEDLCECIRKEQSSTQFQNIAPWRGSRSEKDILVSFLENCVRSLPEPDPFKSSEKLNGDVLTAFFALGVTMLRNGENKEILRLLNTPNVVSCMHKDPKLEDDFIKAVAMALKITINVCDIAGESIIGVKKVKGVVHSKVKGIDVVRTDEALFIVEAWGTKQDICISYFSLITSLHLDGDRSLRLNADKLSRMIQALTGKVEKEDAEKLLNH